MLFRSQWFTYGRKLVVPQEEMQLQKDPNTLEYTNFYQDLAEGATHEAEPLTCP